MDSYDLAILLAKALDSKKADGLKVLKTEGLTTLADYFVICTATSNTQIKAMSDACEEAAENQYPTSLVISRKPDNNADTPQPCNDVPYAEVLDTPETMQDKERRAIRDALVRNSGHRKAAAAELQISERTLYRKIKEYGLE